MQPPSRSRLALAGGLVMIPIALTVILPTKEWILALAFWFTDAGWIGLAGYTVGFVVSSLLFVPGIPAIMVAGFAYGPVYGFLIAYLAATLAAITTFGAGRRLGKAWVLQLAKQHPRWSAINQATADHGFRLMLLLRLSPVVPFSLLNYMMGASRIGLVPFIAASTLGKAPSVAAYVYLAAAVTRVSELGQRSSSTATELLFWLGLVATLVAVWQLTRLAKRQAVSLLGSPDTTGPD